MPKIRQQKKEEQKKIEDSYMLENNLHKFEKHFFEEMTYLTPLKEEEKILDKLRKTSTEKTTLSKIKNRILILILNILSIIRSSPSKQISPKARAVLKQLKDLAILYELGCVDEEEFIFYKMELGEKYYEILNFAKKVDFKQEGEEFYISKIKEMINKFEK
ncbi:hypothetical protein KO317_00655 [Candidatus Micrarchaeota archaeon]|nr:hypothetical protein [Candidatus Micrarchaeota archaeon]